MTLSEQIIQCHLLVHILRMFITDCPARCHHHQLNRMCFCMPPAVHKRIYLMLQFQFIFPALEIYDYISSPYGIAQCNLMFGLYCLKYQLFELGRQNNRFTKSYSR